MSIEALRQLVTDAKLVVNQAASHVLDTRVASAVESHARNKLIGMRCAAEVVGLHAALKAILAGSRVLPVDAVGGGSERAERTGDRLEDVRNRTLSAPTGMLIRAI